MQTLLLCRSQASYEDTASKTIDFLRARLLAERATSKAAKDSAAQNAKRVSTLTHFLFLSMITTKNAFLLIHVQNCKQSTRFHPEECVHMIRIWTQPCFMLYVMARRELVIGESWHETSG
jgi:hypothetical protein